MTLFAFLNMVSIMIMMLIAAWLAGKLSEMKYSFLFCLLQVVVHWNWSCFGWVKRHPYYVWCAVLQVSLILTALTQIGLFMENSIFTKPIVVFMISPVLWTSVFLILRTYDKKMNSAEG